MNKSIRLNLFPLGMKIASVFPRDVTVTIVRILVMIDFLMNRKQIAAIRKNLFFLGKKRTVFSTFKTIYNYGTCVADLLRIPVFNRDNLKNKVEVSGLQNLLKGLELKRGVILVTGHIGNWDLGGVYLASLGYPLTAVVEEVPGLSDFFNYLRTKTGMETIFMRERDKMITALKNNRILVLLGDRDLTGHGMRAKFINGERAIPQGIAAFAAKYKAPLIFGYFALNNNKDKYYKAYISEPIVPYNHTHGQLIQIIADQLANYVGQLPTQWFVFRDEWINPALLKKNKKGFDESVEI
jgi:KDO2-lipid IV(A) lauroyltransferase